MFNNSTTLQIAQQSHLKFTTNEPLAPHTSLKIGGRAEVFVDISSLTELQSWLKLAHKHHLPLTILGCGSNVLVGDGGVEGIVLHLGEQFSQLSLLNPTTIYANAGATLKQVSLFAQQYALEGFEFASGIPGAVGGAMVMNAGAYGSEMQNVVAYVDCLNELGEPLRLSLNDMQFGYRSSILQTKPYIVYGVAFQLQQGNKEDILAKMQDLQFRRESKQPLEYPSCGSTFKRPQGNFASALIEQCGLKGFRVGGCSVSTKHAGFLINDQGATAKDYLELIHQVAQIVQEKTGYKLHMEVKKVGIFE